MGQSPDFGTKYDTFYEGEFSGKFQREYLLKLRTEEPHISSIHIQEVQDSECAVVATPEV